MSIPTDASSARARTFSKGSSISLPVLSHHVLYSAQSVASLCALQRSISSMSAWDKTSAGGITITGASMASSMSSARAQKSSKSDMEDLMMTAAGCITISGSSTGLTCGRRLNGTAFASSITRNSWSSGSATSSSGSNGRAQYSSKSDMGAVMTASDGGIAITGASMASSTSNASKSDMEALITVVVGHITI